MNENNSGYMIYYYEINEIFHYLLKIGKIISHSIFFFIVLVKFDIDYMTLHIFGKSHFQ